MTGQDVNDPLTSAAIADAIESCAVVAEEYMSSVLDDSKAQRLGERIRALKPRPMKSMDDAEVSK